MESRPRKRYRINTQAKAIEHLPGKKCSNSGIFVPGRGITSPCHLVALQLCMHQTRPCPCKTEVVDSFRNDHECHDDNINGRNCEAAERLTILRGVDAMTFKHAIVCSRLQFPLVSFTPQDLHLILQLSLILKLTLATPTSSDRVLAALCLDQLLRYGVSRKLDCFFV